MRLLEVVLLLACTHCSLVACLRNVPSSTSLLSYQREQTPQADTANTYYTLSLGDKRVSVQLALTDAEMSQGLMSRQQLPVVNGAPSGMLFVWRTPRQGVFWMKDTLIDLDAGWFSADGVLREVVGMKSQDLTYRWSAASDMLMGLEMAGGWFSANGVQPGARLDLTELNSALQRRGADLSVGGAKQ